MSWETMARMPEEQRPVYFIDDQPVWMGRVWETLFEIAYLRRPTEKEIALREKCGDEA